MGGLSRLEACVALNMVPGMGPVRLRKLVARFGSPEAVLEARAAEMRSVPGIGPEVASAVARWRELVDLEAELARVVSAGVKVLAFGEAGYPEQLAQIHDPPIVLYVRGELLPRDGRGIGVVGSRRTSHYGTESAKKLSYQLAYAGLTIVSGLARGIDTAAHQGALAAKGRTVAVLGAGLNRIYPPENTALAEKIAASGAVVSEFPMDTEADRQTFPMRNRIISGMSLGLLVVEAGLASGALISANQAAEQGRLVYAVPGQIDRPTAQGSNRLIQQGAKLVMGAEDILDDLQMLLPPAAGEPGRALGGGGRAEALEGEERAVYEALGDAEQTVDEVVAKTHLPTGRVSSTLLALEMRRMVKQLPGRRYVRLE